MQEVNALQELARPRVWTSWYVSQRAFLPQARVPRKPISTNRGLNLANRRIHFVPRFDPVPESVISLNLGIN